MYLKKKPKNKVLLLLLLLVTGIGVNAQEQVLSLPVALKYALKASQTARKAQLEIENGEYKIEEVRSRALPQLSGSGSLTYNPILQLTPLPGEVLGRPGETLLVAFGQKWNSGASVSLSQALFDQSVFTGLKAAKSTQEYYRITAQLTDEQLIEQVANTYYQVLVQKHKITVLDSTITNTQKVQAIIKGQFDAGLARKIDLDRVAVNITNLQSQRQQLTNAVTLQENQLKYAMGMPIQTPIQLPPVDFGRIHPEVFTVVDSLDVNGRSEMKLLHKQEQLLHYQKDSYKAEYYPSLSLSGNYGYQGIGNQFPWGKSGGNGANWFDYASVGVSLKVPLFNGFATRARVRQSDVAIRKLKEDMDQTRLSLNLQYENAKTQISNNLVILKNQDANVTLARQVFENTKNNYNNGLAPLTDLLDAETSLTEANNNHSAALLDYKLAEIQLIKAKGDLKSLLKN